MTASLLTKVAIGAGVLAVATTGVVLMQNASVDYVATVDGEIEALEAELSALDEAVEAGTLSPEAAAEARVKILVRLGAIDAAVEASGKVTLSDAQRAQLNDGLDRLRNILVTYQETLTSVDEIALEAEVEIEGEVESETTAKKRGNVRKQSLVSVISETIEVVDKPS